MKWRRKNRQFDFRINTGRGMFNYMDTFMYRFNQAIQEKYGKDVFTTISFYRRLDGLACICRCIIIFPTSQTDLEGIGKDIRETGKWICHQLIVENKLKYKTSA